MSVSEEDGESLANTPEILDELARELSDLCMYRDLFFENHPLEMAVEKDKLVEGKAKKLLEKFESLSECQVPLEQRAKLLYLTGKCYNMGPKFDKRAAENLSKAVKLDPHLIDAWNELGDCYWKDMNLKDARASFEGALKHERNSLALRCLSMITRQEVRDKTSDEAKEAILKSVELAKEAVSLNTKDGVSWAFLGNAYMCQFFSVSKEPVTLKLVVSAYKQANNDPVTRGLPDFFYNKGVVAKFREIYDEALENFDYSHRIDPSWQPPLRSLQNLTQYLTAVNDLVKTKGKIKTKKLTQMMQSMDQKMLGIYSVGQELALEHVTFDELKEENNAGKVICGRVVGSIHTVNAVPFTFAIVDSKMECVSVTVYNWADGRGAIIGDAITLPEPHLTTHRSKDNCNLVKYDFKSIRVNDPTAMLVNGKQVGWEQFASTRASSTYEVH